MAKKMIICFPFFKTELSTSSTNVRVECCSCPIWLLRTTIALVFLVAITTILILVLQHKSHPQYCPSFRVTALNITQLNFTRSSATSSSTHLISKINVTIVVQNPNKDASLIYDTIHIGVFSYGILLGNDSLDRPLAQENQTSGVLQASISYETTIDTTKFYYYDDGVDFDELVEKVHLKQEFLLKITGTTDVRVMMGAKMRKAAEYQICCPRIRVIPDQSSSLSMWELPKGYVAECYTY